MKSTTEELLQVLRYVKDALQSSNEPWLREAYGVIKAVLEKNI